MSKFTKIFLISILIIIVSFNICYAIDEAELYNTTNVNSSNSSFGNSIIQENTTNSVEIPSFSETTEDITTTTVSGVSSISEVSTVSNILNVALIVVGVLLILLALAILIRLNNKS